jgi:adenylate cyclase
VSSGEEIERKFLADGDLPFDLSDHSCEQISQGYIAIDPDGTEVRLRVKAGRHTLGVKSGPARTRVEQEIEIDENRFQSLWALTEGRRIEKRRFAIPLDGTDHTIELDAYDSDLSGLMTAEVEFPSESEADAFEPPSWLGPDVTGDPAYGNQSLAQRGKPGAKG